MQYRLLLGRGARPDDGDGSGSGRGDDGNGNGNGDSDDGDGGDKGDGSDDNDGNGGQSTLCNETSVTCIKTYTHANHQEVAISICCSLQEIPDRLLHIATFCFTTRVTLVVSQQRPPEGCVQLNTSASPCVCASLSASTHTRASDHKELCYRFCWGVAVCGMMV